MSNERGVPLVHLFCIHRLRMPRAFFGVECGETADQFEDAETLRKGWKGDL